MSNSCNQTPTLSNTAEIVENERPVKLSPLLLNRFNPTLQLVASDRYNQSTQYKNPPLIPKGLDS